MATSGFEPIPTYGSYYQLFYYRHISEKSDQEFARWLTTEKKVAVIPISSFYHDGTDPHMVRLCFAKDEDTLGQAAERLREV